MKSKHVFSGDALLTWMNLVVNSTSNKIMNYNNNFIITMWNMKIRNSKKSTVFNC